MAEEKEEVPPDSPDVYFEPLVNLPPVETITMEENEDQLVKLRAKLFRYDADSDPAEWKERGVGDVKILRNHENNMCRVVMRRDKTLKICANHYVLPIMELMPNCGSDRAWVWKSPADFADEEPKNELLAIRFANSDNAQKFKEKFADAKEIMRENFRKQANGKKTNGTEADSVADKLGEMSVKDAAKTEDSKPADDKSADDKSADDKTADDKSSDDKPADAKSSDTPATTTATSEPPEKDAADR